jgi:hypothetical protein
MRVAIVCDENGTWYVRRIRTVEHDLDANEKIYYCDEPIGRNYATPEAAVMAARTALKAGDRAGD